MSAVYLEQSATGWNLVVEEQCHDFDRLDVTDIPMSSTDDIIQELEQQDQPGV